MMFYKETNFKETPIGKIPQDWQVVKIGDVISLEYGKGLPERDRIPGKYPVVGSNGIIGYHKEPLVNGPGIVVGRKGTMGAVSWIDSDFWPIDTTYYVKTKRSNVFIRWLFYKLNHINLKKLHLADVVPGLKRDLVYSIKMALPSLEEQGVVAGVLGVVDEAILKVGEVIAKTERLKKGLMQELLTKGIGHKEFKDTKIGKIPKEWQVVKLRNIATESKTGVPVKQQDRISGSYPYFGANGIIDYVHDHIFDGEYVIVAQDGSIGAIHYFNGKFWANNHVWVIKVKSSVFSRFIYYAFKTLNWKRLTTGSTRPKITQQILLSVNIPLPPLPEQQKIASTLSTVDKKLELERNEKAKLERIKQGLMDLLLTGKIRVKVS